MARPLTLTRAQAGVLGIILSRHRKGTRKRGPKTCPREHEEQVAFLDWCGEHEDEYPELARVVAVPNGGFRDWQTAKRLKAEGVSPGYPDLLLDVPRAGYHGIRIEMKRQKGSIVSVQQQDWHTWLRSQGYFVAVAKGCEEAKSCILNYLRGSPPREE